MKRRRITKHEYGCMVDRWKKSEAKVRQLQRDLDLKVRALKESQDSGKRRHEVMIRTARDRDHHEDLSVAHQQALDIIEALTVPKKKKPKENAEGMWLAVAPGDETPRKDDR